MHCDNEYESSALTVEAALQEILLQTNAVLQTEVLKVEQSLHRVLAENCAAKINVPSSRNSAMDGYALKGKNLNNNSTKLKIIGESLAGKPYQGNDIKDGECIKIMTGAVMPEHTDTVVMIEDVVEENGYALLRKQQTIGQHIREAGEDIKQHAIAIKKGKRITPADMGFLYACGIENVCVYKIPKVSFFTTGDELKQAGESLNTGDIYDSNRLSLMGMLDEAYCESNNLGIIPDDKNQLRKAFTQAQQDSDCVISTGGVSVGAADHIKDILSEYGKPNFWRIAMKPGRPLTFGELQNKALFFGLPGNPVSVMATFYLFVIPALRKLGGETDVMPQRLEARCINNIRKKPGRTDYQRGILNYDFDATNKLTVSVTGKQQSHLLSGMSQANCFIELPRESGNIEAGSIVTVIPFRGLI